MMGKREVLEQVGAFRTDYFMYAEDMDLCAKIAEAKWKIYYVPDARIVHHAAGSSSLRRESNFSSIMLRESLIRFMEFHRGRRYASFTDAALPLWLRSGYCYCCGRSRWRFIPRVIRPGPAHSVSGLIY